MDTTPSDVADGDQPTFEESVADLESIVHDLEDGQLGLAAALARYEQGVQRLKHCYQLLEGVEQKIELLTGVADDGTPSTQPFAESGEPLPATAGRRRRRPPQTPLAEGNNV